MQLRPYQQEAMTAVLDEWERVQNTLLVLPTGCGKTIVFAKITENCVRTGGRVLVLAHRGELLDQAADKIMTACGLGCAMCLKRSFDYPYRYASGFAQDDTSQILQTNKSEYSKL